MRLGVMPNVEPTVGMDFADIVIVNNEESLKDLDIFVDDIVNVMKPLYGASDDISRAELWKNDEDSDSASYVSTFDISVAGTGAAGILSQQCIFTYRSNGGHIAKIYLMEQNVAGSSQARPPFPSGTLKVFAEWFDGAGSFVITRDDTFMRFALGISLGQNEAIWRKRNRP
jgi:hypothetical protein